MKAKGHEPVLFQRRTLVEQVADSLGARIRDGSFSRQLPPERELCELLGASRPIIRRAIHCLRNEGLLRLSPRQPAKIVTGYAQRRKRAAVPPTVVAVLFSEGLTFLSQWLFVAIDEMRREFFARGIRFDLVTEPAQGRARVGARLDRMVRHYQATHWILGGAPAAVQRWFRDRGLSAVCMGNSFADVKFPYVNNDLQAVTRHAGSVLSGLGHRNVVFFMRGRGSAGESKEEAGFREAYPAGAGSSGTVIKHSGRVEAIRESLERSFASRRPVSAIIANHAEDTLVVINWLIERGLTVPNDVSLISVEWAAFLERIRPLPAWYFTNPLEHARKLVRLVLRAPGDARSPQLVLPKFCRNGAVARPNPLPAAGPLPASNPTPRKS